MRGRPVPTMEINAPASLRDHSALSIHRVGLDRRGRRVALNNRSITIRRIASWHRMNRRTHRRTHWT
jgi:hypothetical protein